MWHDMFDAGISYGEKALRTVLVYLALVILLRLMGKRGMAQLNTLDLVVMLLLSNVVQNAIIGDDNSLSGGLFGAAVLMVANWIMAGCAARWNWFFRLFEGTETVLAKDGSYLEPEIRRQGFRKGDLDVAVHHQGGDGVDETTLIVLEPGGTLLVRLRDDDQAADKGDIRALSAAVARLEERLDRRLDG
ncbi:DUF421 domain-containing protein [Streptomyces sp. NPDC051561]|uniref:DUF421 domain-containing protein n=1 Tax=Streptomyces sp. NPDC051561 TaxID=3365658 RepID=UPI0037A8201C